jgi:hypothetical protein
MGSAAFVPVSAWLPCVAVFALKRLPQRSKLFVDPVNDPLIDRNRCEASTYAFHARMGMMGAIPA